MCFCVCVFAVQIRGPLWVICLMFVPVVGVSVIVVGYGCFTDWRLAVPNLVALALGFALYGCTRAGNLKYTRRRRASEDEEEEVQETEADDDGKPAAGASAVGDDDTTNRQRPRRRSHRNSRHRVHAVTAVSTVTDVGVSIGDEHEDDGLSSGAETQALMSNSSAVLRYGAADGSTGGVGHSTRGDGDRSGVVI